MSLELHKALPDSGGHGQAVRGTVAKTFSFMRQQRQLVPSE
ncbi:hypothetical protein [Paenibacillus sp. Y412MC10]|nr:hypothetical protein [Paenibacillus sp. Y412MC10]ACX68410.1 hypothetical protein GYMC10_6207 [Paenibacillus sp. Y412MC10]